MPINMEEIKNTPYYIQDEAGQWSWEIPVPNSFPKITEALKHGEPSGIPMEELWKLLMSISENEYVPNEVTHIEGVGSILMVYNPVLDEKAPNTSSTEPQDWKLNSEKDYEENFRSSRYCSYCDYTPCRCSKKEKDNGR